jgi:hypothetical protein
LYTIESTSQPFVHSHLSCHKFSSLLNSLCAGRNNTTNQSLPENNTSPLALLRVCCVCIDELKMTSQSAGSVIDHPPSIDSQSSHSGRRVVPYQTPPVVAPIIASSLSNIAEAEEDRRRGVMAEISNDTHPYSEEENATIAKGQSSMNDFLANTKKVKVSCAEGIQSELACFSYLVGSARQG